ncbi:MAG: acetyl-CoA decarbonylase/synthase complex subunit gamma [candidate division NC10 bacterium]|nr:acetyl-CoA decarbonylase/synthase complex subunit gamma [candidate division NC10 bacterium]
MALSAMAIYKQLPKTNCGDCGFPTCMAFAMQVAAKQKALTDCPHLSEEAKAEFAEASTPPMKLVHIGPPGEAGFEIGQETVMFRHEEKFYKPPALAAKIPASLPEDQAFKRLEQIHQAEYIRVGQRLAMGLAVVEIEGLSPQAASARVKALAAKSRVPFVLSGTGAEAMSAAVAAIAEKRPLLYKATEENIESFIPIAAAHKVPLAVGAESLERLADLTKMAKDQGVADLILAFDGRDPAKAIREITRARRAALKKNFRPLGFPALMDASHEDLERETVLASIAVAKYAGIIMINGLDAAELLPILTMVQNIYTDPQVPNEVEAKLYEIGSVNENSPVMFTTNFALTYFSVEGEVERSKVPSYISVVDTEGLGVLNAYAGDKISPEKVVKTLQQQKVAERVKHRKLIIPGHLPSFRAEIEETSEWKEVLIGPENASGIPMFLAKNWR